MKPTFNTPSPALKCALPSAALVVLALSSVPAQAQSACAQAVEMARDNVALRVNGGDNDQISRESAKVHLDDAEIAAADGDEGRCWFLIAWSDYLISIPQPVAAQMRNGMASAHQWKIVAPATPATSATSASYPSR